MKATFLGNECAAAGFRLGGLVAVTPPAGGEADALQAALRESRLVLVSAALAGRIPAPLLRGAIGSASPPVVVIPEIAGTAAWPDPAAELGKQLGLEV